MKPIAKTKRSAAERAAEWMLHEHFNCVITRRALRTKYAKVDFFASDVIGKRMDGSCIYAQATAGQLGCVRARRRKLERIPWHPSETVYLLQLIAKLDPTNKRRLQYSFRVHRFYHTDKMWDVIHDVEIPSHWWRAYREEALNA